jgi:hypothetical protein
MKTKKWFFVAGLILLFASHAYQLEAQESPGASVAKKVDVYVFPAKGQDQAQQDKDESDCYKWAVQQSGYDPINPTTVEAQQVQKGPDGTAIVGAAGGAAAGAAIGAICGDAGKGAAVGAVTGALRGRRARVVGQHMEQGAANQEAAQQNQAMEDNFKKAYSACLEGKGYTVK